MKKVYSINPYNGKVIKEYTPFSSKKVEMILISAEQQFYHWRKTSFSHRSRLVLEVGKLLLKNKKAYASVITEEMGKPISQSVAEIEKCAWLCRYYSKNAETQLQDRIIKTDALKSYVCYEPLGVILGVMPWNYPFWQVFRFVIPALMAGNVAVLKHASNVFGCAELIETIFLESGFPKFCFSNLNISSVSVEAVIKHKAIKAVTLTGSEKAGSAVAKIAGAQIKKNVLELGENNALIILKNCDIERAVDTCIQARFQNTGQSCIAGKRLLLQESISETFLSKLITSVQSLSIGDPSNPDTFIGVLAREDLAVELDKQVRDSVKMGAKILIGGRREKAFYEPTILVNVTREMPVFTQETFGPVLAISTFKTIEEAITLSNDSRYGLGVSVFTKDVNALLPYISQFDEGAVFINELVKSDPRLPFGGVKKSGYGRELGSWGITEFVNVKTVYIK